MAALLELRDLGLARRGRRVLEGASLSLQAGECVGLLGPNGAGKSTLIRAALGLERHQGYSSLARMTPGARARMVGYLPQSRDVAWPVPVRHLVALGRLPFIARGTALPPGDAAVVDAVLVRLGLTGFGTRPATELSGGELARALIARVLAQETPLILADEPVAGLDPAQQIGVMRLLARTAAEGRGVLVSMHDLGLAARFCTRLIVLHEGRIAADGPPMDVLNPSLLARVFGITAWFFESPSGPLCQPLDVIEGD